MDETALNAMDISKLCLKANIQRNDVPVIKKIRVSKLETTNRPEITSFGQFERTNR